MLNFFKQRDKQFHILISCFLVLISFIALVFIAKITFVDKWILLLISAYIVMFIGVAKEVYDFLHPQIHTADIFDLLADLIGVGIGILITSIYIISLG